MDYYLTNDTFSSNAHISTFAKYFYFWRWWPPVDTFKYCCSKRGGKVLDIARWWQLGMIRHIMMTNIFIQLWRGSMLIQRDCLKCASNFTIVPANKHTVQHVQELFLLKNYPFWEKKIPTKHLHLAVAYHMEFLSCTIVFFLLGHHCWQQPQWLVKK